MIYQNDSFEGNTFQESVIKHEHESLSKIADTMLAIKLWKGRMTAEDSLARDKTDFREFRAKETKFGHEQYSQCCWLRKNI